MVAYVKRLSFQIGDLVQIKPLALKIIYNMDSDKQQISSEMLKNATEMICENCKNDTFIEVLKIRKLSKLYTGQQKDTLIPIPMFACSKCGHINKDFDIENI